MTMIKLLEKFESTVLLLILGLLPVFVVPNFPNIYLPGKSAFLVFGIAIILISKLIKINIRGTIDFSVGKFDLAVFILVLAYILSAIFVTPNKMEAFFAPGTVAFIAAGGLLYFIVNQEKYKNRLQHALIFGGVLVAIATLFTYAHIFTELTNLPQAVRAESFNTAGGFVPQTIFLAMVLPLAFALSFISQKLQFKVLFVTATIFIVTGLGLSITKILPGKPDAPKLPNLTTSWIIAIDTFKVSPILGGGPANYVSSFTRFKPLAHNQTPEWNHKFTSARNFYLTVWTETGLIGLGALILIVTLVVRTLIQKPEIFKNASFISLSLALSLSLFFPLNVVTLATLLVLLALVTSTQKLHLPIIPEIPFVAQSTSKQYKLPLIIVTLPVAIVIGFALFLQIKWLVAENYFASALAAASQKDGGKTTYDTVARAINQNPKVDRYRIYLSQVDIAIVNLTAKKKPNELTETDRKLISEAISEAITQAKAAVSLNPGRAENWEFLANTYRTIAPLTKGADDFAIQAYSQAIILDPVNPLLRISLGGIYYSKGDFEKAIESFKLAVAVKPDHANSHYNLSISYRENKQIDRAIEEMKTTLSLVKKDSADFKLAQAELTNLEARKKPVETETPTEELTVPEDTTPIIKPPIELPEDAAPSATPLP